MGHFSSMFNSLARSFSNKKAQNNSKSYVKEAADEMAREAKKKAMILKSSGCVNADGSNNLASVFSRRGEKGVNQDCAIVWEEFGCQEDMMFCGIFDGHGPWGHFVSKQVRNSMPISLLCNWQETLSQTTLAEPETDQRFAIWKHLYLKTCADVDQELQHHRKIDTFNSGTTALTIVRQGEVIYVANVGDSRAVLATVSEEGSLTAVQLTVDFKPNIPQAIDIVSSTAERPKAAKRLVEQAVRAWNKKRRGIAMDDISAVCLFFHS
ncbi:unnamed protein product [Eruca vesicaria subsp. sativa]|uniref:PPM-type phosphatase domain-containing protein n=1 Tax=Eruca vesicaria subsp. sativa TaxID=29727 RepID=A0ABC8LRD0_ERUVS|nr:unnamed protein product [Eruca vesicaria subsp. sativa]